MSTFKNEREDMNVKSEEEITEQEYALHLPEEEIRNYDLNMGKKNQDKDEDDFADEDDYDDEDDFDDFEDEEDDFEEDESFEDEPADEDELYEEDFDFDDDEDLLDDDEEVPYN